LVHNGSNPVVAVFAVLITAIIDCSEVRHFDVLRYHTYAFKEMTLLGLLAPVSPICLRSADGRSGLLACRTLRGKKTSLLNSEPHEEEVILQHEELGDDGRDGV
jgi:hypothetical protein